VVDGPEYVDFSKELVERRKVVVSLEEHRNRPDLLQRVLEELVDGFRDGLAVSVDAQAVVADEVTSDMQLNDPLGRIPADESIEQITGAARIASP